MPVFRFPTAFWFLGPTSLMVFHLSGSKDLDIKPKIKPAKTIDRAIDAKYQLNSPSRSERFYLALLEALEN